MNITRPWRNVHQTGEPANRDDNIVPLRKFEDMERDALTARAEVVFHTIALEKSIAAQHRANEEFRAEQVAAIAARDEAAARYDALRAPMIERMKRVDCTSQALDILDRVSTERGEKR